MLTNIFLAVGAYYFLTKKPNHRSRNNLNLNLIVRNLQYKMRRF
jgi:hypothetical protein